MNPAYKLKDISFAYSVSPVIRIADLEIPKGEITALVGPNGSGKTTLLHLLGFLLTPQNGEICFLGERVTGKNILTQRRRTGLLLQNPYLFHGSVIANVEWGLKVRGVSHKKRHNRVIAALAQVGLSGYGNRPTRLLSGGEAQRVALARVLATEPDVLFLDEPATYMDRESIALTEKIVKELNKEKETTVLFTTHDITKGYSLADRVLSMVGGSLVPASLANFFRGRVSGSHFDTGRLSVHLPAGAGEGTHISIDPAHIVISKESLTSSMRNSFQGRIVAISEENGKVRLEVAAQERFQILITAESLTLLDLRLGDEVWLSFKSTAVKIF
jgi:molybdopterin-binding protein